MEIYKRNGQKVLFSVEKILNSVTAAYNSVNEDFDFTEITAFNDYFSLENLNHWCVTELGVLIPNVEDIQDRVEKYLMKNNPKVAKAYILYRERHKESRFIRERIDYMDNYSQSTDNAATSSETDANANVTMKNVANLEGEVYKTTNRIIQRQRMKDKLHEIFPEVAKQYEKDLDHHIIYTHDEASTPVLKQYCMAVSLYPLMLEGVGNIDGVTPSPPNDIQSFSGQITNLAFLLSSQCKGAVAFGEYFIALNYYVIKEFGEEWHRKLDCSSTSDHCLQYRTIKDNIFKAFKQFVWGINQPASNRGYQSPFINISYYDKTYFNSLFNEFYYPDGTQPEWEAIDALQRLFLNWFNELRLKQVLTFPVESFCLVHDGNDIIDKDYKNLCAEMYAKGHSFFTYISDSVDSLASCCRLRNEMTENTFSPTSGLTGVMTGSCNVITLNINRIVQDWFNTTNFQINSLGVVPKETILKGFKEYGINYNIASSLKEYFIAILERVYKYHIAFKTMLYDLEDKGMFAASNGGYISLSKLYSTIGINGLNEAAEFLGLEVSNNKEYIEFLQLILGTIKEQNKKHSINDDARPFLFNSECVPAESLGSKNYNWDLKDEYWVPKDRNLYNSYFYNAHDNTSIIDKFILHGRQTSSYCDGGSALHCNLEEHLSKQQYLHLIDIAIKEGTNYFTFNIPNSKCEDCNYIVKAPIKECPKCKSNNITWYTRIIGYLRPIKAFCEARQIEANKRVYSKKESLNG